MCVKDRVSAALIGMLAFGVGFVDDACGCPVHAGEYRGRVCDQTLRIPCRSDVGDQRLKDEAQQEESQKRAAQEESWKQQFYNRILEEVRKEAQEREVMGAQKARGEAARMEAWKTDPRDVGDQRLKDEAQQEESQKRAAQEESWKQQFYNRILEEVRKEAQEREAMGAQKAREKAARMEAWKTDLKRKIYGKALEEVQKGTVKRMASELKELRWEISRLRALLLKSCEKEDLSPTGKLISIADIFVNLSKGVPRVEICNSMRRVGVVPEEVTKFARSLNSNLAKEVVSLRSAEDDVSVLSAERFRGTNTLFLPGILSAERVSPACSNEDPTVCSDGKLDLTYERFLHFICNKGILKGTEKGPGNPSQRDAIQDWVVKRERAIRSGRVSKRYKGLCSVYDLRWHLARALIAASEEGDVWYYNFCLDERSMGTCSQSKYGKQDGVGYTLKTVKALGILLDF
jgi:hypothetical protein